MVAIHNGEHEYDKNPKTLGDWVKNFRLKKIQMKRKLRSSGCLRICAILSTALVTAELELRRKQQERFQKWLDFQTKINKNYELQPKCELRHLTMQRHQQGEEEDVVLLSNHQNQIEEKNCKHSDEITNLWKCELSELDNFMRSISSSGSKNNQSNQKKSHSGTEERENYEENIQTTTIKVSS